MPINLRRAPVVRVLVVDDFAEYRKVIPLMLARNPCFQVIGEASDGLEAVLKAVQLKPDLVLMDIGLPSLNGIEAARKIRELVPESKIIFLSQESSADVVQEAMGSGGSGYVVKAKAGKDLFTALENVFGEWWQLDG
jgi:DNA-binding NarL/FixJ family response regulator